jgi:hypothetical protein
MSYHHIDIPTRVAIDDIRIYFLSFYAIRLEKHVLVLYLISPYNRFDERQAVTSGRTNH